MNKKNYCHVYLHSLGVAHLPRWTAYRGTLENSSLSLRGVQASGFVFAYRLIILSYQAVFTFLILCSIIFVFCIVFL